ncbi:hypothetical protein PHYBLDRAFT_174477 [Phycomyces blakesleeanus NRRL 1555(-)]|uniref:Uncharacterized protein n=1 Tax=Phycomyces blakesleeanus (strain ATCC 8743b / DSM 1359 / FGSC 10004 / NBRC 33097 / NRRL 1555) TaxID=763407 RepID=A0A162TH37_PHYB8|nr:hypothetical protein PHYBLDRAFT_174477 [Phycomyces blakesleeanus NRRL 1555(-)]OAD67093.1 hypothetical protein PHYBLDRAFT_174477 [Phycomyces blakesleeanus NRRL 1555(-)]|eukprot:XP_018285133.1 hypothetical protein PHYBLDRAFT_174477 [Phycomyces blakesleeanus NRRL 1555(-)]
MTNDIHDTLQALPARMEALEARSAAPPVALDGSPADEDDTMLPTDHIVERPIASDLTPFPELSKAIPGMERDFFRQPLDEASRRRFLLNCPRNVLRQYQAPVLNYSGVGTHTKRTDAQLADIQFRLSGLTPPIDLFAHDVLVEGSIQVTQALGFANTMHELLSDLASVVTQMRSDNICRDANLPITPIVTNSALEPKPLLDSQRIVEQAKLQRALHGAARPSRTRKGKRTGQSNRTNKPTQSDPTSAIPSPTAVQVSDNQYTTVGGRLQLFRNAWTKLTNEHWVRRTVEQGYDIPFTRLPPISSSGPLTNHNRMDSNVIEQEIMSLLCKKAIKEQGYDTNHPSLQVERYPERSISPSPQPDNHLETAFLVHRQGPGNHFGSPSRAPANPATDIHAQPSLVPRIAMDQSDTPLFHGSAGTSVVDRPAEGMEWTLVPPRTSDVHDMEMGSASICDGRTFCTLDNLASPISLSAMEPTSPHTAETTTREGSSYVDNAQLVERPLVSSPPPAVVPPANPHPSSPGPSRTRLRRPRSPEEPTLEHDRVGHKLRRLEDQGFDDNANIIILNRDRNHSRQSYNRIQRAYIDWAHHHDVDPFIPNPVHIVNYLAYGATHLKWKASTCQAYRSAILDLYSDKDSIVKDSTYIEFFSALNEQNLLSFHRPTYDIAPVIRFIHNLGPNDTMNAIDLTRKLCWLLAICGFLRPADLERVDDHRTSRDNGILRLVIVAPKEKRSGRRIERVVAIQPHEDPLLCPVATYLAYKSNIAFSVCVRPHPVLSQVTLQRLVRDVRNYDRPIGSERISKHIQFLMEKIPRPSGALLPKARALGPTLALASGASVEDILVHGSWASSAVFDTFYRLSRQTVSNFSTMTLTSSSGYLDTQPESLANEE